MPKPIFAGLDRSVFDDANPSPYADGAQKGINESLVRRISADKAEPQWMLESRLHALKIFREKTMPTWGADLSKLDLENIIYYAKTGAEETDDWKEVPDKYAKYFSPNPGKGE